MNIDWNKAPEGATHCCTGNHNLFYKMDGDVLLFHCDHSGWVESEYKDISDLSDEYDVIERPKQEEVDMNKQVFKAGDKVYFPSLTTDVLVLHHAMSIGVYVYQVSFAHRTIRVTTDGKIRKGDLNATIFHATPENKALLDQLYRTEFEAPPVKWSGSDLTRAKLKEFGKPILCWCSDKSDEGTISFNHVVLIAEYTDRFITPSGVHWKCAVPYTGDEFLTGKDFE